MSGRLAKDFPSFIEYQNLHSAARRDLAILSGNRGQFQDAQRDMARVIAVAEALVRKNPDVPNYRRTLAVHHANLGDLWHTAGRPADAEREYREALRLAEALAAEHPGLLDYRALRALYRSSIAFLLRATGRYLEAESAYEKVVAELEALRREFPGLPQFRASLASACNQRGAVLDLLETAAGGGGVPREGDRPGGRARGRVLRRAVLPRHGRPGPRLARATIPRSTGRRTGLAGSTSARSATWSPPSRATPRAARIASCCRGPPPPWPRSRRGKATAGPSTRPPGGSRTSPGPRSSITTPRASCRSSWGRCGLAKLPEAERDALARSLADRAMAQLTKAIDKGYRNIGLMRKDPDLDPIRSREDFQPLLDRVEAEMAKGK